MSGPMRVVIWFVAGFLGTLVFHQLAIGALWGAGVLPRTPWSLAPVPPLGVPSVVSLAFWGGVWGIVMMWIIERWILRRPALFALVFGALAPSVFGWFVLNPLRGRPLPSTVTGVLIAFFVNAAWGVGTWLIAWALTRRRSAAVR